MEQLQALCIFPERLHPASAFILEQALDGRMIVDEFRRMFSLPNSEYIPLGACLADALRAMGLT